jgi:glycosyltransferase involved in cell wall biosynthesis
MKKSIIEALKATPYERYLLSSKLQTYTKNRLTVARVEWLNFCQQLNETKTVFKESDGKYTVLITNFNGKFDEIKETLLSIKNFTRKPEEIIVVDDGSSEISYQILASVIADFPLHVNVLRTDTNNGLSSARNFGLDNIKTEFFISMDNDNVLSNHFAEKALRMISKDKEIAAVTSWSTFFNDGDDWNSTDKINHPDYTPEGADIATGISRNCFGDATAMYRTSYIKECNGWKSNKSDKWEDWSLFLHLTLKSYQISVIPEVHLFYRVKKNSMLRTYREFGSWLNLYSNLQIHPKYLYSLVNSTQVQRTAEVDYTKEINAITASLSWRATEPLRIFNSFSKGRAKVFLKRLSFGK